MGYYQFNPKNHICSLAWTGIVLASQIDTGNSPIEIVLATSVLGMPTVFVGINIREKAEQEIRTTIVNHVNKNKEVTTSQIANLLNLSGQQARDLLNSLVKEERIEMTNRSEDMAVVYTPAS